MLAIVLAVVNLLDLDPNPVRTPAAHLGQRLTGGSQDVLESALAAPVTLGGVTIAPVCRFGAPQLTSNLLSDVADLASSMRVPACAYANDAFSRAIALPVYAPFMLHAWATARVPAFSAPRVAMPVVGTFHFVAPVAAPRFAPVQHSLPTTRAVPALQPLRAPGRLR